MKDQTSQYSALPAPASGEASPAYHVISAPAFGSPAPDEVTLTLPSRWAPLGAVLTRDQAVKELESLGRAFARGVDAVVGVYFRIVRHIRTHDLDPAEVIGALRKAGFSESKISELRRLAAAPEAVWREYAGGQIGFRIALDKTRLYYDAGRCKPKWKRRQLRRAAGRLIELAKLEAMTSGQWEHEVKGFKVRVYRS